jgi:hypothetical protein
MAQGARLKEKKGTEDGGQKNKVSGMRTER